MTRSLYKRPFDLAILVAVHVVLLPLFLLLWLVIALVIWLGDRGPVFFKQQRGGKDGREITVLKFRTMVPDADRLGPAWTTEHDPRLTRVGRILRRTALDELPQVLSIWKGDMSLVGPRALPVKEQRWLETNVPGFEERLVGILPGLTGLSQIYNRADSAPRKLSRALEYRRRMSPWLDTKLLVLSVWRTVTVRWDSRSAKPKGEGAEADPGPDSPGDPAGTPE